MSTAVEVGLHAPAVLRAVSGACTHVKVPLELTEPYIAESPTVPSVTSTSVIESNTEPLTPSLSVTTVDPVIASLSKVFV